MYFLFFKYKIIYILLGGNMNIIFIVLVIAGIVTLGITAFALFKNKKVIKTVYVPIENKPSIDVSYPSVIVKDADHILYEKFMKEYDSGNFGFNDVNYRKGAAITCPFGISEGYKYIGNKMEWGYVRLHTGVDRAHGGEVKEIKDIVQLPFNFDKSNIIEYKDKFGKYYDYGTLVLLDNLEYAFEMRIGHMDPKKNIIPWSYQRLLKHQSFQRDWLLGSAGTLGASSGNHTHTEFVSLDDSCEVFDILLEEQYGTKSLTEYSKGDILREYKKYEHFKNADDSTILKDWEAVKSNRGATFVNKYKYKFRSGDGKLYTRYSSALLFNGL